VIRQRLTTALVLAALLLLALFVVPVMWTTVLIGVFMGVGAWEWSRLAGLTGTGSRVMYLAAAALVAAPALLLAHVGMIYVLQWVGVAVWLLGLFWMLRFPVPIPRAFSIASGLIALPLGWLFLSALVIDRGPEWTLFLFLIVAGADVGAFFSGRAFGRNKLAPTVSPGKTWEGVAGGVTLAATVGLAGGIWFGVSPAGAAAAGALVAGFSILGDLTVSMLKRDVGLKDSGRLFPGHGGVLDRIDSLLAALPLFMICFGWVSLT
jgi:phosphatidate cytidylyltransferase